MLEQYISNTYLRALAIFVGIFISIKIVIFLFGKILPKLTAKTKTNVDDIIIKKSAKPITIIAILVGFRFAIGELNLKENFNVTIEGILTTLMIAIGAVLVYYIIEAFLNVGLVEVEGKLKKKVVRKSLVQFFQSVIKITIFIIAFLIILSNWGIQVGPLLAGIGVAGIAVAFALQNTLSNVFGGISLLLDKSINVGDLIKLDDKTSGKILQINLRSTKIRTFDNELVIVPNSKLAESNIHNIALPEPRVRVVVPFGVAYGSEISKVKKIVLKEIKKVKNVLPEPEPVVRFLEMADSSLNFKAYFNVKSFEDRVSALDEANTRIYNALNKAGIEIPFPQMDVHLKKK